MMARIVFIVQGEGRGHMSQSLALREFLEDAGHSVVAVLVGSRGQLPLPEYFTAGFQEMPEQFRSPYLIKTPNQKGIDVGRSILVNLFSIFTYLGEVRRIRRILQDLDPDVVVNFYDLVGALALRKTRKGMRRIGIGHHFLLHLEGYRCGAASVLNRWLLGVHTRMIMRSCDRVLALSFRDVAGAEGIEVIPPLIRKDWREINYRPGERYLAYLMSGGYLYDLVRMAAEDPSFRVDVFTELSTEMEIPQHVRIHPPEGDTFRKALSACRGLITTAGFDTVAEAAYHGIPVLVIPARHHFEQRCNSMDVVRSRIGRAIERLTPEAIAQMRATDAEPFRDWAGQAGPKVLKAMVE
ncbi:MAG: glycosyltransferase family protein [Bacteroidales bacterium]